MAEIGFKVAKENADAETAADKDLVYTTKYNGMKIWKHDTKAIAGSVAHGAGYTPSFLNYRLGGGRYRMESMLDTFQATYTDGTNIVFSDADNFYFIFVDKIA